MNLFYVDENLKIKINQNMQINVKHLLVSVFLMSGFDTFLILWVSLKQLKLSFSERKKTLLYTY